MSLLLFSCVDMEQKQVQLITTLDNSEDDLLTLEYIKVCVQYYIYNFFLTIYNKYFQILIKPFCLLRLIKTAQSLSLFIIIQNR